MKIEIVFESWNIIKFEFSYHKSLCCAYVFSTLSRCCRRENCNGIYLGISGKMREYTVGALL